MNVNLFKSKLKIVTVLSLLLNALLFLRVLANSVISENTSYMSLPPFPPRPVINQDKQITQTPIPTNQRQATIEEHNFPSDSYPRKEGSASVESLKQDFERNIETVRLSLHFYDYTKRDDESYTFTMPAYDYIGTPMISYQERYGCFQVSTSGYSGYYIFKIPDGTHIATGEQYSRCVTWLDNHRVLIVEQPYYNPENSSFSIFNAETGTKQIISFPLQ